ncbi:MAG: TetR family transcriptional regulator [Actinomycetota bacterium]
MADQKRGRAAAEERMVRAAGELLSEVGPRAATVRAVAARAGVNHGLVHHYFGSKDGLLRAAMVRLVSEHAEFARRMAGGDPMPAPFALLQDQAYLRAVMRCVLDGEMGLATTELTEGVSVPRRAMEDLAGRRGLDGPDAHLQAAIGIGMAIEMGWAALEPFIFAVTGVEPGHEHEARAEAVRLRNAFAGARLAAGNA